MGKPGKNKEKKRTESSQAGLMTVEERSMESMSLADKKSAERTSVLASRNHSLVIERKK